MRSTAPPGTRAQAVVHRPTGCSTLAIRRRTPDADPEASIRADVPAGGGEPARRTTFRAAAWHTPRVTSDRSGPTLSLGGHDAELGERLTADLVEQTDS
jgi:hypothetical protein